MNEPRNVSVWGKRVLRTCAYKLDSDVLRCVESQHVHPATIASISEVNANSIFIEAVGLNHMAAI